MRTSLVALAALVGCSNDVSVAQQGNLAPAAVIDSPDDQAVFTDAQTIDFIGTVADGNGLDDLSVVSWSSSIDGELAPPSEVFVDDSGITRLSTLLTEGIHTITLAVADAIGEGFASYYALSVLNRRDEGDAFFFFAYTDWDHDQLSEWGWYSAEQRPLTTHPTTMNADYWEHECQQPVQNIASEYDWMRGLWDLYTYHGVSTAEILSVFADVGPSDWTVTPDVDCGAAGIECPAIEILDAAGAYWFGSSWSFECEDGICR